MVTMSMVILTLEMMGQVTPMVTVEAEGYSDLGCKKIFQKFQVLRKAVLAQRVHYSMTMAVFLLVFARKVPHLTKTQETFVS